MSQLKFKESDWKKIRLFVGTPMYGGMCNGIFSRSIADLSAICTHHGIQLQLHFLMNESLITRARNYVVDEFLRSNATHLMFIDADIGFDARDILGLIMLSQSNPDHHIMGAAYPKKCISWEKVRQAALKGFGEKNPNDLEKFVGDFVFNPKQGTTQIQINTPVEVLEIGTGFMLIRRDAMEQFRDHFWEKYKYKPDHIRTEAFDGSRHILQAFQAEIDPKTERYLSEDYWFCQKTQEIGLKTWLCPWMRLSHAGTYMFGGSLADLAAAGAAATADPEALKKPKK